MGGICEVVCVLEEGRAYRREDKGFFFVFYYFKDMDLGLGVGRL